jgi:hypothetical protein
MINMEERVNYLDNLMAELARAQVQSEIAFKASGTRMDALFRKMDADTAKMKEDTARMKKTWGDLANKMGTVAEDVVAPNIPRLALDAFGFGEVEDLMVRARRMSRRGERRRREWDVVCSGPDKVIMVEVKSTPTRDNIREVPVRLAEFFDFYPEYEDRELIGMVASWSIPTELLPVVSEAGLYGIAMGEDNMDIVAWPASAG